jgi:cathepsin L
MSRIWGLFSLLFLLLSGETALSTPLVFGLTGEVHGTGLLHKPQSFQGMGETTVSLDDCDNLPANFDLRELGVVSEVRDQGSCGSCWAFSKTSALESAYRAAGGESFDLSEQELVSNDRQNYGCGGGNLQSTEYQTSHGQGLEKDFPYTARDSAARNIPVVAKSTSWVHVAAYDVKQLQCALYKSHTVPWITANASNWGGFPSTETPRTSCGRGQTNHAIGVVGWKTVGSKVYFIMRNSWGKTWGAAGYGVLALGCDSFGDEIAYPLTDAMPCKPPTPKLPIEVSGTAGDELVLAVKKEKGATYAWYKDGVLVPTATGASHKIKVTAKDSVYKVVAKTPCGSGESQTRVKAVTMLETPED